MVSRDEAQISRRNAIKKAAVATGAVAWSVPTVQILTMGGAGAKPKDKDYGSVSPCGDGPKPSQIDFEYKQFVAPDPNDDGIDACSGPLSDLSTCTIGGVACASTVYVTVDQGVVNPLVVNSGDTFTIDTSTRDQNSGWDREVKLFNDVGLNDLCQTITFHQSCSDTSLFPGVVLGSLTLKDWRV